MYLFVFTFVILSILGVYTELFALRMATIANKQTIAADAMMFWHGAVYTYIRDYKTSITTVPTTGCAIALSSSVCGLPTFVRGPIGSKVYLPSDYGTDTELVFTTRLFKVNTDYYVLTYVANGTNKLGFTTEQILRQMKNANLPVVSYGRVATGTCVGGTTSTRWLQTQEYAGGTQVCYSVPTTLSIGDGAVGIISNLGS